MTAAKTQVSSPAPHNGDRLPPQDLEAEMSTLGAMMLDRECIGLVVQVIPREESERFYRTDHRQLFRLLVDLYDSGKPMDLTIVRSELERAGLLNEVGGVDYLIELVQSVSSAANAEHYARVVRDKSLLRDLIRVSARMLDDAHVSRDTAESILDSAEQMLFEVTEKRVSNHAAQISDVLSETFAAIEQHDGYRINGVPSGFLELDDLTGGFQKGELVIIAARPSMGKTALGLGLADHAGVGESLPVVFFSMEMGRQQIVQRMLCSRSGVDSHKLRRGMVNDAEMDRLREARAEMEQKPIFLDDTPGMSVMELRAKARRLKMLHGIGAVYVDYLQLMRDPASAKENRQQEIATISRGLKALARELNLPVVAMAQLNRNPEGREGNRPRMSDLRESGAIEQDADTIILLHRDEYYNRDDADVKGKATLIVCKQRNGPIGEVTLQFNDRLTRFSNLAVSGQPDTSEMWGAAQ